ncbi:MAG: hydrogenase nickel incorporation protein HypB [Veillonellales bacterium]
MKIKVVTDILEQNDQLAEDIHNRLSAQKIFVVNLLGSPGCGKTTLLERTIALLRHDIRMAVIEGDLFTAKDAERIERQGVPVIQINTSGGCHLNADMVDSVLEDLNLEQLDLLFIENVGNLVCPAEFNLGEDIKITVLSVTEGDDKPLKYPLIFRESRATVLNKVDLVPYTDFDMAAAARDIRGINPAIVLLPVSCRTGEGVADWCNWLKQQVYKKKMRGTANGGD